MRIFETIFLVMLGIEFLILIPFTLRLKELDKTAKYIFLYTILSFLFAGISYILAQTTRNNMWFFPLMQFLQFLSLSGFYFYGIQHARIRKVITVMPVIIFAIYLLDVIKIDGLAFFNSISASTTNFVLIVYGFLFFMRLLNDKTLLNDSIYINSLPDFWFNAGLFIYYCASFLFNLSYSFLQSVSTDKLPTDILASLSITAGIIQFLLFFVGLVKIKKARNEYS